MFHGSQRHLFFVCEWCGGGFFVDNKLAHSLSLPAGSWWALFSLFLSLYLACFSDSDFSVNVCSCVHLCVLRPFFPLSRKYAATYLQVTGAVMRSQPGSLTPCNREERARTENDRICFLTRRLSTFNHDRGGCPSFRWLAA